MKTLTLAFLFRGEKILLAMKKQGFGIGKWNGYGGKLENGEEPIDGILREIEEESGLKIPKDNCKELGYIDFYFNDKEEWNQKVIIYRVDEFDGEPVETEEMKPEYFDLDKIPWNQMWAGDDEWIPNVIASKHFTGEIHFIDNGAKVVSCNIK